MIGAALTESRTRSRKCASDFPRRDVVLAHGQGRTGCPASGGDLSRFVSGRFEAMTHKGSGRPAGPFSIGRALDIPAGSVNDDLRSAVDPIDRVHHVGLLPRIPMEFRSQLRRLGRFDFDRLTGEPVRIVIDCRAPYRAFAALHEIGHFLDLAAFGTGPIFGSIVNTLQVEWLAVATETEAYRELKELVDIHPGLDFVDKLRAEELWARSYAQYVAICSGSNVLLDALDTLRASESSGLHIPIQWEDNGFDVVADEIDLILNRLGWRR